MWIKRVELPSLFLHCPLSLQKSLQPFLKLQPISSINCLGVKLFLRKRPALVPFQEGKGERFTWIPWRRVLISKFHDTEITSQSFTWYQRCIVYMCIIVSPWGHMSAYKYMSRPLLLLWSHSNQFWYFLYIQMSGYYFNHFIVVPLLSVLELLHPSFFVVLIEHLKYFTNGWGFIKYHCSYVWVSVHASSRRRVWAVELQSKTTL